MGSHVADDAVAGLQTPHEGASVDLHKAVGTMARLTAWLVRCAHLQLTRSACRQSCPDLINVKP